LQYISELEMSVNALQAEVTSLSQQLGLYDHRRAVMTAENVILKQKLATLGQTQRFKEARSEALMKEVERLSYQHQQQLPPLSPPGFDIPQKKFSKWDLGPQQQHSPLSPTGYELLKQQFSKLDLGAQHQQQQLPPLSPTGYELQLQRFSKVDLGSQ
jgi:regulator of replication initiation timing